MYMYMYMYMFIYIYIYIYIYICGARWRPSPEGPRGHPGGCCTPPGCYVLSLLLL